MFKQHQHNSFLLDDQAWAWSGGSSPIHLALQTRRVPQPAADDVVVRNGAIGLNPVDWKVIETAPDHWSFGHVPGVDGAGQVISVGDNVDPAWLGRRVAYHTSLRREGSFAHHTHVAARALLAVPDEMPDTLAASIPCPAMTAWLALEKIPPRPGAPLLISGAGAAVGLYLVQLAIARGFQVSALCHPRHWENLRALGVCETLSNIDSLPPSTKESFHAVIDCISAQQANMLSSTLAANGHLVCIQGRVPRWPSPAFGRALSLHEVALGALHQYGSYGDWARLVSAGSNILEHVAVGSLQAQELVIRDFDSLPVHLDALRQRTFSGKAVITLTA